MDIYVKTKRVAPNCVPTGKRKIFFIKLAIIYYKCLIDTLFFKFEGLLILCPLLKPYLYLINAVKGIDAYILLSECDGCGGISIKIGAWFGKRHIISEHKQGERLKTEV